MKTCTNCKSDQLSEALKVVCESNPTITLRYEEETKWGFIKTDNEPIRAIVCSDCGNVTFLVNNANRKWV